MINKWIKKFYSAQIKIKSAPSLFFTCYWWLCPLEVDLELCRSVLEARENTALGNDVSIWWKMLSNCPLKPSQDTATEFNFSSRHRTKDEHDSFQSQKPPSNTKRPQWVLGNILKWKKKITFSQATLFFFFFFFSFLPFFFIWIKDFHAKQCRDVRIFIRVCYLLIL